MSGTDSWLKLPNNQSHTNEQNGAISWIRQWETSASLFSGCCLLRPRVLRTSFSRRGMDFDSNPLALIYFGSSLFIFNLFTPKKFFLLK